MIRMIYSRELYESYEWGGIAVFKRGRDEYAVHSEAGCSCDSFMEKGQPGEDALHWLRGRAEMYRAFERALDGIRWYADDATRAEMLAEIRQA